MGEYPEQVIIEGTARFRRSKYKAALKEGRWRDSIVQLFTNIILRAILLAMREGLNTSPISSENNPVAVAHSLREALAVHIRLPPKANDKLSTRYKAQLLSDVLGGVIDIVSFMGGPGDSGGEDPYFLAAVAIELGRADGNLVLAETGHWDQVAIWEKRKPAGRKVGYRVPWHKEAAPVIQAWIDAKPSISRTELIENLWEWLVKRGEERKDFHVPDKENLRKALSTMHSQTLIRLNPARQSKVGKVS